MISILHVAAQSNIIGTDVLCYGGGSAYVRLPAKPIIQKYGCAVLIAYVRSSAGPSPKCLHLYKMPT